MISTRTLKKKLYGASYRSPFDRFNEEARLLVEKNSVVLHVGCGSDSTIGFRKQAKATIGLDYNAWIKQNQDIDFALIGDLTFLPLNNECADLIAARWVLEHIEYPDHFFSEALRILKPGGRVIILTPNLWNYVAFVTKMSPHWFQKWFIERIIHSDPEEVFATFFRANTPSRIRRLANKAGLTIERLELTEDAPNLLAFNPVTFLLGVLYERLVTQYNMFSNFRGAMMVVMRKDREILFTTQMAARINSSTRPHFIYITGCDGAGKTTQAELLLAQLKARGINARHLWLRYPFLLSLPLLAYARLCGYSWREVHGQVRYSYWDFRGSWLMRKVFPWALLLDAALATLWQVYLPLWRGETVVCERFILDMLVDQAVAFGGSDIHQRLPGRLYLRLLPSHSLITILDLDPDTIRERRTSLLADRCLHERLEAFRAIARDLQYMTISSKLAIDQVNRYICERL